MGLQQDLRKEPVANLALREAILVESSVSVREAVRRMKRKRLGCVIVVSDDGRPEGTCTEEELIHLLVERPQGLDEPVRMHLSAEWAVVGRDDPIARVLEAMQSKNLRFVCVTDREGRAVALTGQKGLMEYIAEHFPRQVMVQRVGGKLAMDEREGA
jgi:predicted transcriptional regulator